MRKSLLADFATVLSASLVAVGCGAPPTAPVPEVRTAPSPEAATIAEASTKGGKPSPGYVTHPMTVTFVDRAGDHITSDGGGSYTDDLDGRWALTDYADPTRPDHFQFLPATEKGSRAILLAGPGSVPPTECGYFRFSVTDEDTPDLWSVADGWSSTGTGILQCEQGRHEYLLDIGECVAITRGSGWWTVVADGCATEIWSGSGRQAELLGTFPVSFAFEAIDL